MSIAITVDTPEEFAEQLAKMRDWLRTDTYLLLSIMGTHGTDNGRGVLMAHRNHFQSAISVDSYIIRTTYAIGREIFAHDSNLREDMLASGRLITNGRWHVYSHVLVMWKGSQQRDYFMRGSDDDAVWHLMKYGGILRRPRASDREDYK